MIIQKIARYLFFILIIGISFCLGILFFVVNNQCIDVSVLEKYNHSNPSILLDSDGNEWARYALDKREPISLDKMPEHLINAFIAAEDWNFYNHSGLSFKGIIRSTLVNLYHGRKAQGASTITQQLVRLLFFDAKKTFERKLKEQLYALIIERQFTKEQILELYLNHVYFGCGVYGVQAACQRFWGKSVSEISIDQAATLAGIVRSPGNYCPLLSLDSSQKRRNLVLYNMKKLQLISQQEYEQSKAQDLKIIVDSCAIAPYLKETIRLMLEDLLEQPLYGSGLVIQTTLDSTVQKKAEKIFHSECEKLKKTLHPTVDGALISMDVQTGEIKALIGGYDYTKSKFNRALQAHKQMGSLIKPLLYAAALKQGLHFNDTEVDEPFALQQENGTWWSPHNYNHEFNGKITLANALSHSNNIVAIKTFFKIGAQPIIDLAKKCEIQGPFHYYPSLALGCIDVTLNEVVGMFNIFANSGIYVEPHYIKWVKDQWGKKIYKSSAQSKRVLDEKTCSQVAQVLSLSLERIAQTWPGQWLKCFAISKTGTTNDSRICWFAGSTPNLTTAVYIGCDDNTSLGYNVYPLRTAFPIWLRLNQSIDQLEKKFKYESSLQKVFVDEKTGDVLGAQSPGAIELLL